MSISKLLENEIKHRLDMYIVQLRQILQNLESFKNRSDPGKKLGDTFATWLIGAGAEEFLKSATAGHMGRKFARDQLKSQEKQQYNQFVSYQENSFFNILVQVRAFLGSISIVKPNLKAVGNSSVLLKKLAFIESHSKFETKVRKIIVILTQIREDQLVYNKDIPKLKEQKLAQSSSEYYETLKNLEFDLRHLIDTQLSKISSNWWKERIPEDVREQAEIKKRKNESPWPWMNANNPVIAYVDFADYSKIITKRDNWDMAFKKIFHDREWISTRLKELEPIRNAIAHPRNLTSKQIQKLDLYAGEIIECIKNSVGV